MKAERPPTLAHWVVQRLCSHPSEGLVGDLEEEFQHRVESTGNCEAARQAYRRDVLRSLPPLLRMRGRVFVSSVLVPGIFGAIASVCWFLGAYASMSVVAGQGGRPLGNLSPGAFLGVWVFGAAVVGGLAAGWFRPPTARSAGLVVGVFTAAFVLVALDARPLLVEELVVGFSALGGAVVGSGLGARGVATRSVA